MKKRTELWTWLSAQRQSCNEVPLALGTGARGLCELDVGELAGGSDGRSLTC